MDVKELEKAALDIRINLLRLCSRESIHIGGDLSVADMMTVLWQYKINYDPKDTGNEDRDRFVLSKGHSSAVVCFNQAMKGCYSADEVIEEYAKDGGRFSMHSCNLVNPYVEVSTGSLGHGMPVACGMAMGLRLKGNHSSRVYTVLGDGEHSEGSVWEAVMNAAHYGLGNLVAFVDNNGLEADGTIDELTGLGLIADKYRACGWKVYEIDGNDVAAIKRTLDDLPSADGDVPIVIIGHTVKGKGVPFMEGNSRWHAGKITKEQMDEAVEGLKKAYDDKWGFAS